MFVLLLIPVALGASPPESEIVGFIKAIGNTFPTWSDEAIRRAAEVYFPFGDVPETIGDIVGRTTSTTTLVAATVLMTRGEMKAAVFAIADSNPSFTRSQISETFASLYPQVVPGPSEHKVQYMLYFRNMRLEAGEAAMESEDDATAPHKPRRFLKGLAKRIMREEMIKAGGVRTPLHVVVPLAVRRYETESRGERIKYPSMARYYGKVRKELKEEATA